MTIKQTCLEVLNPQLNVAHHSTTVYLAKGCLSLLRQIDAMKCCGNCGWFQRKPCPHYWKVVGRDVHPCWEQTTERSS